MKRVKYTFYIDVIVDMPDDVDPVDKFVDCDYDFHFDDDCTLLDTDLFDYNFEVK